MRPHLGRRAAEAAAEGAIEMEQVAEADIEGNRTDGTSGTLRVHEHAVRAQESLAEHELRERLALWAAIVLIDRKAQPITSFLPICSTFVGLAGR
jgi:hypothetical protein